MYNIALCSIQNLKVCMIMPVHKDILHLDVGFAQTLRYVNNKI